MANWLGVDGCGLEEVLTAGFGLIWFCGKVWVDDALPN